MVFSKVSNNPELFDESFTNYIESEYIKIGMGHHRTHHHPPISSGTNRRRKGSIFYRKDSTSDLFADARIGSTPSQEVLDLLGDIKRWDFDMFRLTELTGHPLVVIGQTTIAGLGLLENLRLDSYKLRTFLLSIEDAYFVKNPYHNCIHASDVTQTFYYFLRECEMGSHLSGEVALTCLLAAAIHDVAHPGVTGKYLIATQDDLAITYNDKSPLENMHLATAFSFLRQEGCNFLDGFSKDHRASVRHTLIEMVLATDNDQHFEIMKRAEEELGEYERRRDESEKKMSSPDNSSGEEEVGEKHEEEEEVTEAEKIKKLISPLQPILLKVALHAADISNPAKDWDIYNHWTDRLMEEFYGQGDKERDHGIPISFAFDREDPVPRPKFQQGFLFAIVEPLYAGLNKFPQIDVSHPLGVLRENVGRWKRIQDGEEEYESEEVFVPTHELLRNRSTYEEMDEDDIGKESSPNHEGIGDDNDEEDEEPTTPTGHAPILIQSRSPFQQRKK